MAPDWIRDEGGEQDIPFSRGDLVDRRSALQHADEDYEAHLRKFAVGWRTRGPITIEFDLGEAFLLDRVWILMGSSLPAVRVTGLVDGQWRDLGGIPAEALEHRRDFPERIIRLTDDGSRIRQVRLEIAGREEGQRLIIPEVEIWSRD